MGPDSGIAVIFRSWIGTRGGMAAHACMGGDLLQPETACGHQPGDGGRVGPGHTRVSMDVQGQSLEGYMAMGLVLTLGWRGWGHRRLMICGLRQ